MLNMVRRNCKVFLRDRAAVLYSFMAVFIIIGLYVLFLGDAISREMADVPGGRFLMDSWIMAGMLAAGTFTTTLGALGLRVEDRTNKIEKDFKASPLGRWQLTGAYMMSSIAIGFLMSLVTLVLAEGYILLNGGSILPFPALLEVIGLLLLSVVTSSAMLSLLVSFVGSTNAFAGISTVAGTLIGFITGIYVPIGQLPPVIQAVVKVFPVSHASALLRQVMMKIPLAESFAGAPAETLAEFQREMGVRFEVGGQALGAWAHLCVLGLTIAVFYALAVTRMSRQER